MKLKPEVKAKWLEALRSGRYPQGIGALRDGPGFCCLGVLTDLYARDAGRDPKAYWLQHNIRGRGNPPPAVAEWAFENFDPEMGSPYRTSEILMGPPYRTSEILPLSGRQVCLAEMNDGYTNLVPRRSFAEIADVIERDF